jgi:hypothetical protein
VSEEEAEGLAAKLAVKGVDGAEGCDEGAKSTGAPEPEHGYKERGGKAGGADEKTAERATGRALGRGAPAQQGQQSEWEQGRFESEREADEELEGEEGKWGEGGVAGDEGEAGEEDDGESEITLTGLEEAIVEVDENEEQAGGEAEKPGFAGVADEIAEEAEEEAEEAVVEAQAVGVPTEGVHGRGFEEVAAGEVDVVDLGVGGAAGVDEEYGVANEGGVADERPVPGGVKRERTAGEQCGEEEEDAGTFEAVSWGAGDGGLHGGSIAEGGTGQKWKGERFC